MTVLCAISFYLFIYFSQQWKQDLMVYLGVESGGSHLVHGGNVKLA